MVTYNLARAREAVQYLVDSSYFHHHIKKLRNTIKKPRALPFKGESECLNELIVIGRQSAAALENLLKVAEFKRGDRNDYQREYMAIKRKRDAKIVKFEETVTGRRLTLDERINAIRMQYVVWNKERDALMKRIQTLPWAERNQKIREFWQAKEIELDALVAEARPVRRRRVVEVPRKPTTALGHALVEAKKKSANNRLKGVDKRR